MATKAIKTGKTVKRIAGEALKKPGSVTKKEIQKLAASVEAHIQPRGRAKGRG